MSARSFEEFLAKIYVDAEARAIFLSDPRAAAAAQGLTFEECEALARIDVAGLDLAARSFARKHSQKKQGRSPTRFLGRLASWWAG